MLLLSHLLGMDHIPHSDFSSIFPEDYVSPSLNFNLPNSKLGDSPPFNGELHSTSAYEESTEDVSRSEWSPCLSSGFASWLEEAPNSNHEHEGRRKLRRTRGVGERGINKSGQTMYKGVRNRKGDRWVSEIREPGKKSRIWLGTFSTPEMAATAYDVAAFNLKTPCAYLNFPEYVSSLPISPSRSPKDIQEAAAEGADHAASRGFPNSSHMGRTGGLVATPARQVDESSTSMPTEQQKQLPQSRTMETKASLLADEDMIFDMPNILSAMAEGLMITPPLYYLTTSTNAEDNTVCDRNEENPLWNL